MAALRAAASGAATWSPAPCSKRPSARSWTARPSAETTVAALLVALRTKGETVGEIVADGPRPPRSRPTTSGGARIPTPWTTSAGPAGTAVGYVQRLDRCVTFVAAGRRREGREARKPRRDEQAAPAASDVLEALGVVAVDPERRLSRQRILDEVGIGFLLRAAGRTRRCVFVAPGAAGSWGSAPS